MLTRAGRQVAKVCVNFESRVLSPLHRLAHNSSRCQAVRQEAVGELEKNLLRSKRQVQGAQKREASAKRALGKEREETVRQKRLKNEQAQEKRRWKNKAEFEAKKGRRYQKRADEAEAKMQAAQGDIHKMVIELDNTETQLDAAMELIDPAA